MSANQNLHAWMFEDDNISSILATIRKEFYINISDDEWSAYSIDFRKAYEELKSLSPAGNPEENQLLLKKNERDEYEVFCRTNDNYFGIDFLPWDVILGMNVDKLSELSLPKHVILAHLLMEITFDGYSEKEMIQRREDILSRLPAEPIPFEEAFDTTD